MEGLIKKKIIRDSAFLSSAGYLNQFLFFIRGFIIARLLDPTLFGYLSGTRLILQFTSQMHFGVLHGMTREFSIYKGANDIENFQKVKNNGISLIAIFSAFIVLAIIIYTFCVQDKYSPYTIWGIRIFALIAFTQQSINICHAFLRVDYHFTEISTSQVVLGFSSLILAVALILWIGFYGAPLSFLIGILLSLSYLVKKIRFDFKLDIDKEKTRNLLLVGAPISFFYFNGEILNGLDKLMIINFLNVEQLGFYAIAFPFLALLTKIPHSISYIVYPKMLEAYGSNSGEIDSTKKYFEIPTQVNACIVSFSIGILFFCIKYLFFYLLPRYTEAVSVVRILSFATFFSTISIIAIRVLITQKSYKILFIFQGIGMLANILLNYTLIKMGYGIRGVALATGISYITYSFLVLHFTLSQFYQEFFKILINQLKCYWPILYVGLCLLIMTSINSFHVDAIRGLEKDIYQLIINLFTFSLFTAPLFIITNRKTIKAILR